MEACGAQVDVRDLHVATAGVAALLGFGRSSRCGLLVRSAALGGWLRGGWSTVCRSASDQASVGHFGFELVRRRQRFAGDEASGRVAHDLGFTERRLQFTGRLVERAAHDLVGTQQAVTANAQALDLRSGLTAAAVHVLENLDASFFGFANQRIALVAGTLDIGGCVFAQQCGVFTGGLDNLGCFSPARRQDLFGGGISLGPPVVHDRFGGLADAGRFGLGVGHQLFG